MLPSSVKFHLVQSTREQLYLFNRSKGISGIPVIYQEVKRKEGWGRGYIENCVIPSNKGFAKGLDQPIG